MLVALALVDSVKPNCLTEHNTDYSGNDLNVGTDHKQPDLESCRSYCASNHLTATYFTYKKPSAIFGARGCWCKTSNSGSGWSLNGISGEVCRGKQAKCLFFSIVC